MRRILGTSWIFKFNLKKIFEMHQHCVWIMHIMCEERCACVIAPYTFTTHSANAQSAFRILWHYIAKWEMKDSWACRCLHVRRQLNIARKIEMFAGFAYLSTNITFICGTECVGKCHKSTGINFFGYKCFMCCLVSPYFLLMNVVSVNLSRRNTWKTIDPKE